MQKTVLHVSPHPDDESIGVPCTLLALKDAGWRVVNLVCSLGRETEWGRREQEVVAATTIAEFENVFPTRSVRMSSGDNHGAAQNAIIRMLKPWLADPAVGLVIGPHLDDGHHAHETVARAIRDALVEADRPIPWWMWGIWRDLPQPTMYVPCHPFHVDVSEKMITEYKGENSRNSYRAMHRARRRVNAVLGAEQVFGFGEGHRDGTKWAELLAEVSYRDGAWVCGPPRQVDVPEPTTQWTDPTDPAAQRVLAGLTAQPVPQARLRRWFPIPRGPVWRGPEGTNRSGSAPTPAT